MRSKTPTALATPVKYIPPVIEPIVARPSPKAGSTANVQGSASNGTWTIVLTYTDAGHRGWTKELVGTGSNNKGTLAINGKYVTKKSGAKTGEGSFQLNGKCK